MKGCFSTSAAGFKALLRREKVIDEYLNILNLGRFRSLVTQWTNYANSQYGVSERLFFDEQNGTKAVPNQEAFQTIDFKKGIEYKENEWVSLTVETNPLSENQDSYQTQSQSRKQITPEVKEQLLGFLRSVNPDFRVEVINDLSVNGLVNLGESLIQLKRGSEFALTEEVSHVWVESLTDKRLKKELMDDVVRTKMYQWVIDEYGQIYGRDYDKLKREAAAKLIGLYIQDREAFNYWSGSDQLNNNLGSLITRLINWIKRKLASPYSKAALRILSGSTAGLDTMIAREGIFYQLDDRYKEFDTIDEKDMTKYGKIYVNLNNTILDYTNWNANQVGNKNPKLVKSTFFSDLGLRSELDRFYSEAKLTKFGRELKDKIGVLNPNRIIIFTDAPITDALITRLEDEFGQISLIRTGYNIQQTLFDEWGNPVDQIISGSEKEAFIQSQVDEFPKDNLLFVDNRSFSINIPNLKVKLYDDKTATYTDVETKVLQETIAQRNKEFSQAVVEELGKVDKDNLYQLAKQSMNMVRNQVKKLEREGLEELSSIFKDKNGNLLVPVVNKQGVLTKLLEDTDTFEQGLLNFVQTIESTRLFFNKANESDYAALKELIDEGTDADLDKAIREVAVLMRMILSWEQWVNEIRPFINDTKVVSRVINDLSAELERANVKLNQIAVDVLSKSLSEQWKSFNEGIEQSFKQGFITKEQRDDKLYSAEKLAKWLKGEYGDMNSGSAWFENPLMQSEPLIQAISKRLEISMIGGEMKSMEKIIPFQQKAWELQDKIGMTAEDIGKRITVIDQENYFEDGVMKQRPTDFLLTEWQGLWQRKAKEQQVRVLKQEWLDAKNSFQEDAENKELIYRKAKDEYEQWLKDNWYDEVTNEGKDIYGFFGLKDDIFDLAKERQKELYDERKEYQMQLKKPYLTEQMEQNLNREIDRVTRELRLLRNEYTEDGQLKDGIDLLIARKLKDTTIIDRQIYDYEFQTADFLDAINEQIVSISDENTRQILLALIDTNNLAELYNTAKQIAPQTFVDWLDRNTRVKYSDSFYEERSNLISQLKELTQNQQIDDLWKDITNLTSFLRDKDLVFDASDSNPEIQEKVKQFELLLERLKQDNETDTRVLPIIKRLSEIQSKRYTDYYRDVMYDKLKDIYTISSNENFLTLINDKKFREWIMEEAPEDFQEWFARNHYVKQVWDEYTESKSPRIVPTYIWMKTEPSNPIDIEVIPGWKYNKRILKDSATVEFNDQKKEVQLKTPKIDWVTWNPLEGNWLPKSEQFKNKEYFKLRESKDEKDKLIHEYLRLVTDKHIQIQMDGNYDSRLGFRVPRFNKKYTEGGVIDRAWKAAAGRINPKEEGTGGIEEKQKSNILKKMIAFSGIESEQQVDQIKRTDYLGNEFKSIYTPYTQYLNPEDQTKNLVLAISNYSYGVEKVKALIKDLPQLTLLQQVFDQFKPKKKGTKNQYGEMIDASTNNRLNVLNHIIDTKLYSNYKNFELGVGVDSFASVLRKTAVMGSQSDLNLPNAVKNWMQGQLMNTLFAKERGWSSRRNVLKAIKDSRTSYMNYLYQMSQKNKSIDYHILSWFNPLLEKRGADFSKEAKSTELQDRVDITGSYFGSTSSEFSVMSTLLYSHLFHQDVEINGEKKKLYDAFTLNNGVLSIKPNVTLNSKPLTSDYLIELKLRFKMMMEEVQGKQWNQTLAQRYTVWQSMEFFKKFFITMFRKRFFTRRDNIELGETEGIYTTTLRWMIRVWYDLINGSKYAQAMTPDEMRRVKSARDEFILAVASLFTISYLFGFDEDDEDKYKKLTDRSWLENMALLIALNTKRETDALTPFPFLTIQNSIYPPILNETYNFITSPFVGFTVIQEGRKMLDSLILLGTGDDKAYYDKNMPAYLIEKGDTKFGHYLQQVLQIDNFLYQGSPEAKIQVIVQSQNR